MWTLVACYVAVPPLAGLQVFEFVPGYAQCSLAHLSESGKMIHYGIVLTLFFLTPLVTTTISYVKVAKMIRQHKVHGLSTNQSSSISVREIKLSKSLFAVCVRVHDMLDPILGYRYFVALPSRRVDAAKY